MNRRNLFARALLFCCGSVPFLARSAIGWFLGYSFGLLPTRERRIAQLQLQVFLQTRQAARLTRRAFANAGRTLLESMNLSPALKSSRYTITPHGWDNVAPLLASSRPVVALTAHTGNWDLLGAYVIAQGVQVTTIGREARNHFAQSLLAGIRKQYGIQTIWRSDKGAIKQLTSQLKQGNTIAALIDQDTRVKSTFNPFFGRPAKTPSSLVALGRRHNALFISAFIFRTGWRTFSLFIEPFTDEASEEEVLNLYNVRLEQYIRLYPDQWVWFHKRWRTETNGNTLSSSQYLSFLEKQLTQSDDVRY
jgi:Kdo2-lipid IVA lauroyltransferase/acyltransferase